MCHESVAIARLLFLRRRLRRPESSILSRIVRSTRSFQAVRFFFSSSRIGSKTKSRFGSIFESRERSSIYDSRDWKCLIARAWYSVATNSQYDAVHRRNRTKSIRRVPKRSALPFTTVSYLCLVRAQVPRKNAAHGISLSDIRLERMSTRKINRVLLVANDVHKHVRLGVASARSSQTRKGHARRALMRCIEIFRKQKQKHIRRFYKLEDTSYDKSRPLAKYHILLYRV